MSWLGAPLSSADVLDCLMELMIERGIPEHIRSDNGSGLTGQEVRTWLARLEVKTLFIEPGSPWENGHNERFNGTLRDELLNGEILYTLEEARLLIEQSRILYNARRPHSALGYRPPAPAARRTDDESRTSPLPSDLGGQAGAV
jgi:transposase InsO family protein